ncbi:DUF3427 domain-containing protein [Domibacillus iocasae]|uniref:NgoFVII family restriction endonuclease n=1 Tax=Domibacillus iocasae TaxID=1714016 RepID=A0A1E7DQ42_9BACI|nr:DEAD/DEAH box helicase [Domibacillus iocasae]OES44798.1 NgoFVII family restriction endonuclease [Domibacillus iocasae]
MENFIENLQGSLYKGFINQNELKPGNFKPQLLINNAKQNENVLTTILEELDKSQSFLFSVAFITESGLATLKAKLLDLHQKGICGRILTSTFLNFNQPKVFSELMKIENIEVRTTDIKGFHAKGYIFDQGHSFSLIVGSSNLTAHALKVNYEWNVKLTSHGNGEIVHHFKDQFENVWEKAETLTQEWIDRYEVTYSATQEQRAMQQVIDPPTNYETNSIQKALEIKPNKMQETALQQIQSLRNEQKQKALVISATGTGKTYLSAFDVRAFRPKRMLFVVHREQILQKAMNDFRMILGGSEEDFGILSGTSKQVQAKYLFATIQTISKREVLQQFEPDMFDYILIDEVHKAGAESYLRVINHFVPAFLMGMTATPERTDDFNIYELFDYNIAYEIRLQEALEEDMLCPFHYFGVTDLEINGEVIDEKTTFMQLVSENRINHIIDKIGYYSYSGKTVKGLMFCSRKEEAKELSAKLNERGYRTVALTGDDRQEVRLRRVEDLENGKLDYILTVDIFNEGIDIPCINQVVMLRQTQSSIVFIQQLGRGLRKHDSKDFVTIIDFIGNYKNNYMIPVALSGDQSQNKDNIRRKTAETNYISGASTINFEEIARKQIFKAINNSTLNTAKLLKEAFVNLKNKIGHVPLLHDFVANHSIDPIVIADKYNTYYHFLISIKEKTPILSLYEQHVLTMLSLEVLNGKRRHEVLLLDQLLGQKQVSHDTYLSILRENDCTVDDQTIESVQRIVDLSFFNQATQKKYGDEPVVVVKDDIYKLNEKIQQSLSENLFFETLMKDVIETAKEKNKAYLCEESLTIYQKYSRKDVCKLLNWKSDESSTIYGYKPKYGTCPIFITYHKNEEVEASVNYGDEFISPELLKWFTRSNRTLKSTEVQKIVEAEQSGVDIHIFVKKDDDEGTDFYYLGKALPDRKTVEQTTMQDKHQKDIPVVTMSMVMEKPIEHSLYHYLTEGAN